MLKINHFCNPQGLYQHVSTFPLPLSLIATTRTASTIREIDKINVIVNVHNIHVSDSHYNILATCRKFI